LSADGIQIHVQGFVFTIQTFSAKLQLFFDNLVNKVHEAKQQNNLSIQSNSNESVAD